MNTITRCNGVLLTVLLMGLSIAGANAQGPDGPPPGRPGGGPPRPITAATIPVSTLTTELVLSSSQQAKIQTIQKTFQDERRTLAPPPPRPDESGQDSGTPPMPPAPPSEATREKIKELDEQASQQVEAVLTDTQKSALASLLQTMRALQVAGVSPRIYGQLGLTADQKQQIASIVTAQRAQEKAAIEKADGDPDAVQGILGDSRRKTHEAVLAVLTDTQKALAEKSGPGRGQGSRDGLGGSGPHDWPQDGQGPPPPPDGQG